MLAVGLSTLILAASPCQSTLPSVTALSSGLEQYVNGLGEVDYQRVWTDRSRVFSDYLDDVSLLCSAEFEALSLNDRLAMLINFYNAWVIQFMVGDNGKPDSILKAKIKGKTVFDAPLIRVRWHPAPLTLNDIEKVLLRKLRPDPRYHFALVCGAHSCPRLRREAYEGKSLDEALNYETERFLADKERNQLVGSVWRVSKIFDWYKDEFGSTPERLIDWIENRSRVERVRPSRVEYLEYDWRPNQRK